MILHTVNSSPLSTFSLQDCLKQMGKSDILLLIGDAVIASTVSIEIKPALLQLHEESRLYILQADLDARGLTASFGKVINYIDFVHLSIKCKSQLAW